MIRIQIKEETHLLRGLRLLLGLRRLGGLRLLRGLRLLLGLRLLDLRDFGGGSTTLPLELTRKLQTNQNTITDAAFY